MVELHNVFGMKTRMYLLRVIHLIFHALVLAVLAVLSQSSAFAQEIPDALEKSQFEIAPGAVFQINVEGTMPFSKTKQESGKAFAVGANLLVTSRLVVGRDEDWDRQKPQTDEERVRNDLLEKLSVKSLVRRIVVQSSLQGDVKNEVFVADPAPTNPGVVGLIAPNLAIEKPFSLSLCGIDEQKEYYVLVDKLASDEEVSPYVLVKLKPIGFNSAKYGPFFAFESDSNVNEQILVKQEGSPILDTEGNVVAVFSGRFPASTLLAAPVQTLFPGASSLWSKPIASNNLGIASKNKCVIADTVAEIKDDVSTHFTWKLASDFGSTPPALYLAFEGISKRVTVTRVAGQVVYLGRKRFDSPKELEVGAAYKFDHSLEAEEQFERRFQITSMINHAKQNQLDPTKEDSLQHNKNQETMGYISRMEVIITSVQLENDDILIDLPELKIVLNLIACKQKYGGALRWYTEERRCDVY